MVSREVELAKAHKRCPFVTMGQYGTWYCGLIEQFGWRCENFCSLQMGGRGCNPIEKIESRISHLEGEMRLAKRLLLEAQGIDTSIKEERKC